MRKPNLKDLFEEVDRRDPKSKLRRRTLGLYIDIALRLAAMRKAQGLSQRELAVKLSTSHPTISRWETPGYSGYTLAKLQEFSDALNHDIDVRFIPRGTGTSSVEIDWSNDFSRMVNREINIRAQSKVNNSVKQEKKYDSTHMVGCL